ncbi:hypothetical protein G5V58_05800 [Nocardioides anomalus]|uniref:DUF4352 domain-containing protein n=1 Tax=Nocardioides anomalus TaxID=2712223 RepID=A0A6G6WAV4_9ACTN|nr:hypothetical protein [Nocardioides anomalus]QIG42346.1 hypothetical protein G5V58_05800 [Nocardioides anomalus]
MKALVLALVLTAAAVVAHRTTPSEEEQVAPFVVAADAGDWGQARTVGARVDDVGLATRVTDGEWTGTTDGVWVVVAATAETTLRAASLDASLWLGDRRYDASDRPGDAALGAARLSPRLPVRGTLVFEVPAAALRADGGEARVRFATESDPRLDSVVEVPVDLTDLEPEALVELTAPERTTR